MEVSLSFVIFYVYFALSGLVLGHTAEDWQHPLPLTGDSGSKTPVVIGQFPFPLSRSRSLDYREEHVLELAWIDCSSWRIGRAATNDVEVSDLKASIVHVHNVEEHPIIMPMSNAGYNEYSVMALAGRRS